MTVHFTCNADSLCRELFPHHLVGALCSLGQTVSDEDRIANPDKDVVDAVNVDVFDASLQHVRHAAATLKSAV